MSKGGFKSGAIVQAQVGVNNPSRHHGLLKHVSTYFFC